MSTSASRPPTSRRQRSYVPATALAKSVKFTKSMMQITLTDGRVLAVPLLWFPTLQVATAAQRMQYEIAGGGISLHWPELDEDLSIAGLMAGVDRDSA
jgi:hypothetical protein